MNTQRATPPASARGKRCADMWRHVLRVTFEEKCGIPAERAALLADLLLAGLREYLGGAEWYMPRPSKAARNAAIRQQFTGGEIGLQRVSWAGLSDGSIYRICRAADGAKEKRE